MRTWIVAILISLVWGCANTPPPATVVDEEPSTPLPVNRNGVRVEGLDGTVMTGEMLNGSVTIDSGMGPLTLQSSSVHTITFASDGDRIEADNINVSGKIREEQFNLRTKHGVFTLLKERLRRITFINNKPDEGDVLVRKSPTPPPVGNPPAASSATRTSIPPTTPPPTPTTGPTTRSVPPPTATRYRRVE